MGRLGAERDVEFDAGGQGGAQQPVGLLHDRPQRLRDQLLGLAAAEREDLAHEGACPHAGLVDLAQVRRRRVSLAQEIQGQRNAGPAIIIKAPDVSQAMLNDAHKQGEHDQRAGFPAKREQISRWRRLRKRRYRQKIQRDEKRRDD